MMMNQSKPHLMKKYEDYLKTALKKGEITKYEMNILEAVFRKKLGVRTFE